MNAYHLAGGMGIFLNIYFHSLSLEQKGVSNEISNNTAAGRMFIPSRSLVLSLYRAQK